MIRACPLQRFPDPKAYIEIKSGSALRAVGVLLLLSLVAITAEAATITYQDATTNGDSANIKDAFLRWKPSSDTDLNSGATPDTNNPPTPHALGHRWYGDDNTSVKRHWLFQYDLLNVPTGARIVGADLNLWMQAGTGGGIEDGSARTGNMARVLKTWIEGTKAQTAADTGEPTWSHQTYNQTAWATAGATGAADIDTTNALTVTVQADGAGTALFLQQFSVSPIVESWWPDSGTGTNNYGMLLYGGNWGTTNSTAAYGIVPSEATQTGYRPKLTVNYDYRGPGAWVYEYNVRSDGSSEFNNHLYAKSNMAVMHEGPPNFTQNGAVSYVYCTAAPGSGYVTWYFTPETGCTFSNDLQYKFNSNLYDTGAGNNILLDRSTDNANWTNVLTVTTGHQSNTGSLGFAGGKNLYVRLTINHPVVSGGAIFMQVLRDFGRGQGSPAGTQGFKINGTILPDPPSAGASATANSTSQITWGWTQPSTKFAYQGFSAASGGTALWTSGTNVSSYAEGSLSANTQYTRYIGSYQNSTPSTATRLAEPARYTLQVTPTAPTFSNLTIAGFRITTTGPVNLASGNSGVIFHNGTADRTKVTTLYDDVSGLSTNTQYTFKAKGVNGDNAVTAYSATASKYTMIEAATGITFGTITATSIQAKPAGTFTNLTAGNSAVRTRNDTIGAGSGWVQNQDFYTSSSLSANMQYDFEVESRNGDAVATGEIHALKYTLQATPTAPTFSNVTTTGFRVTTTGPVNLTSGSSGVIFHNGTADRAKVTTLYDDVVGLVANTQYTFKAKGVNGEGVVTAYSGTASQWTLSVAPTSGSVIPDDSSPCLGDSITWTAAGGFGAGKVQYYRYVWDQNATHTWTDTEAQWSSGTIQTSATSGGTWYLHVKGYNGANVGNGTYDYAINTGTTPTAPTNCKASPPNLCSSGSSTLSATPGNDGDTVEWFTESCGGTPVSGGSSPTVSPATTTTYYARSLNTSSGCVSGDCCQVTLVVCACVPMDFDHDCDVDKTDFIHFVSCASAPGVPQDDPNCADAKFDGDDDVDQDDFAIFQRCYSGKNNPPEANCMN